MDIRLAEGIIFIVYFGFIFLFFRQITNRILPIRQGFSKVAQHPWLPYALVLGLTMLPYGLLYVIYQPYPSVHDEFGYLLGADALVHGRLSSPTHPMWTFFETHHIFHVPSYSQKYPIGQSVFLAIGQGLFGKAIVGVWICMTLVNCTTLWMLQGLVPRSWALAGALGTTVYEKFVMHWGMTFWGGGVAMWGGVLFFGALIRLLQRPTSYHASLLGLGAIVLANSRPFEGLVAILPGSLWLIYSLIRQPKGTLTTFWLPFCLVMSLGVAGMMYHNYRVVGKPLSMYYNAYNPQYEEARPLLILPPNKPPVYRHKSMKDWHDVELALYRERRNVSGFLYTAFYEKPLYYAKFYLSFVFILPFLTFVFYALGISLPFMSGKKVFQGTDFGDRDSSPDRNTTINRFVLLTLVFGLIVTSLNPWSQGHYFAPFVGLIVVAIIQGFRYGQGIRFTKVVSVYGIATVLVLGTHVSIAGAVAYKLHRQQGGLYFKQVHEQTLTQQGGKHLILVRYSPAHSCYYEWVFNGSDLENAPVLWAHDMGNLENTRLLNYYKNRKVWRLEPDTAAEKLIPLR
ncbi:MAG: hypothetical protein U0Y10_05125 [Spirosomataceae bacterium]